MLWSGFGQSIPVCPSDCIVEAASATSLILVDGVLDEKDWQQALPAKGFLQATPDEGVLAAFKTQVRILHDQKTLYIGATLHDRQPHRIRTTYGRRDHFNPADWFSVALDANNDKKSAFHFAVNAAGVRVEGYQIDSQAPSEWSTSDLFGQRLLQFDPSWDAEWTAKVRVDSVGWTVEMAIPISLLRITNSQARNWGINFRRWVARAAEYSEWALVPLQELNGGRISRFGTLHLAHTVRPSVHRHAYAHLLGTNFQSAEDDRAMTLPVPGVDVGLILGQNYLIEATLVPEFSPDNIKEYINDFHIGQALIANYDDLFSESTQFIASPASGSNQLFGHLASTLCADLLIGGTSLNGRLPGRVTMVGIGRAYLPSGNARIPTGFSGRIQKDIGVESQIGVSGTSEPFSCTGNETTTPFKGLVSAVSMDWDFRGQNSSTRWAGQIGISQASHKDYDNDSSPSRASLPSNADHGIAARIEYGQLGHAYNWFTRIKMTHPDYVVPTLYQSLLPDRTEVTIGVRHARVNRSGFIQKGHFNLAISQWLSYSEFTPKETILTGQAAVLTSRSNLISIGLHVGMQSSGHVRLGANASASTDLRRRFTLTPGAGFKWIQNGLQISHGLIHVTGTVGARLTLEMQLLATHASGNMNSPTWLSEFLASEPSFTQEQNDTHPSFQCRSGFRVEKSRAESTTCMRTYVYATIGLFSRLNFEVGTHLLGIGSSHQHKSNSVDDQRADLVGQLRWEFKPGAFFTLGANVGKQIDISDNRNWTHLFTLLNPPLKGQTYHLFTFSITRRFQR